MSNEERKDVTGRDPEATAGGPFFNDVAEESAQPVVPLAPSAFEGGTPHSSVVVPVPDYAGGRKRAPVWPVALIVVSLLTGLVGGVAGLWLYQRTRNADAEQTSAATQTAPQETTPVATDAQPAEPVTDAPETTAPVADENVVVVVEEDADDDAREEERPQVETRRAEDEARERERAEVAPPPRAPRSEERRGRETDDDGDERARARYEPRPGVVYDTQGPVDEGSAAARRAEREEQRLRRAERQRRREERRQRREERAVDSVRGIFEGQPPE